MITVLAKDSRTRMSQRNLAVSVAGRILGMITSFAGRTIFVRTLQNEFLGLGGFFGNIFCIISMCELGIGAAVAQSLYKPIADDDEYNVSAIIRYYTKINCIIAACTGMLSLLAIPVLPYIVKGNIEPKTVLCAYLLFAFHTAVSYLFMPKRMLFVCDQRMYVVTAVRSVFGVLALLLQSAVLVLTKNYVAYLAVRIAVLGIEDVVINIYADKKYPFLFRYAKVDKEYKRTISQNVKALVWHKAGSTLSRSVDSILLSVFVGLSGMGMYSNYALVIGTVSAFFDIAMNSVSASVGNLGAGDRGVKSEKVMRKLYFLNFWLLTVGTSMLVCILNPFIKFWLGENMLFSTAVVVVIMSSFYFSCIRDPVQIFLSAYGLFKETRLIPVARAILNLVLSVILVQKMGISGVFLGTTLSTVFAPLYFEVKMLYKYGFGNISKKEFMWEMASYIFASAAISCMCMFVCRFVDGTGAAQVVIKAVLAFVLSNAVLFLTYRNSEYFKFCKSTVNRVVLKRRT